jgi:hypothetical protein
MYKYFTGIILIFFAATSSAQNPFELGGEYIRMIGKGYSHSKAAVRGESFSNKNSFSAGITYQLASSKSYSVSHGVGFYFGYRYSFSNKLTGNSPFAGARLLFSLENFEGKSRDNSLLLTPFAEAGYHFVFGKSIFAAPAVGFGYTVEFTKGYNSLDEDRGQRILPSLSAGYRF